MLKSCLNAMEEELHDPRTIDIIKTKRIEKALYIKARINDQFGGRSLITFGCFDGSTSDPKDTQYLIFEAIGYNVD
jgi:hypothetical protein